MAAGYSDVRVSEQIQTLFQAGALGTLLDGQLLDRFVSRESGCAEPAFAALVERHGPMVLGVCRRLLADSHLAEDAFQATFLVLARRASTVRNRDALGGWLHRVAKRVALRLRVKHDRLRSRERPEVGEVAVEHAYGVERDELRAVIDEEIDRLGDGQRLPVILCCLGGLSQEEAAQRLHWPLGTVKSRLARGRKRLQERLGRRGFAPSAALALGSGLLGKEASAALPPALVETTTRAASALVAGGTTAGVVPAAVSAIVREELGFMILAKLKLAAAISLTAAATAALVGFALASATGPNAPKDAPASAPLDEPEGKPATPALAAKLSASGRVLDAEGKPVAGATVILREWSVYRVRGMSPKQAERLVRGEEVPDILAKTESDPDGRFRFQDVPAPSFPNTAEVGQSVFPWDVAALAPGHGTAWVQLTPERQRTPIALTLGAEGTIRGRVVEPGGKPVAGAKVKVFGIDPLGRPDEYGMGTDNRLNLTCSAFPLGAKTGADGRFTIRGLPGEQVATLVVTEPRHERLVAFAATTTVPQPDLVSHDVRAGKPAETRQPVHTGEFTLTARTADHVLSGRVVYEADGKPASGARVWQSWKDVKADEDGRFRIEGLTSGPLELHAIVNGSDAAPVDITINIPEEPRQLEHNLTLPRGLILSGRVVDAASGRGVAKALLYFVPKVEAGQTPTHFGFSQETGADGRFRLVVPPGRGTVDLRTIPQSFSQPERRYGGEAPDPKFSREVEGKGGQTIELADFRLSRGGSVVLRVVDPEGRPVANAQVDIRDANRGFNNPPGRSDAQGRYEAVGLALEQSTVIDILAPDRPLGAMVEAFDKGAGAEALEIRLQPLVALTGRVLDEDGKPLTGPVLRLYRNVLYPGQNSRSFGVPIETRTEVGNDGTYTFDRLIPGATYNTQAEVSGHATATSRHVKIKPGTPVRLDDFRLPASDQDIKGTVVDARGKPLAGVTVSYDRRSTETQSFYAPNGGVWFQETDASGRFQLTTLPRGAFRLMAYRRTDGAGHQIKNIKYVDIKLGETEVRIELPDPNDRLRGID